MSLIQPRCWTRGCGNYIGVRQPDNTELSERNVCAAFPDEIPEDIAYGDNLHLTPIPDQVNDIVFEKE